MEPRTHLRADPRFCGTAIELGEGSARVALEAIPIQALIDPAVGSFSAACRARMLVS